MKKSALIFLATSLFFGCSTASNKKIEEGDHLKQDTSKLLFTSLRVEELKYIHTFEGTKGEVLGRLYGKELTAGTYTDFLIVTEQNGKLIPIYSIEKTVFKNTNAKEVIPISNENFYGYHVLVVAKSDMDIELLSKENNKILKADPITIKWNETEKVFKVLLAP